MSKERSFINAMSIRAEYERIFHKELSDLGNIYCPFHDNKDTPSAKLYDNVIYCFSCRRIYGTYDLLYAYDKDRINELLSENVIEGVTTSYRRGGNIRKIDVDREKGLYNVLYKIYGEFRKKD